MVSLDYFYELFSDRLKALRKSKKMTQKEFAEKLGIHGATLSAYELGNNKPSIDVVLKISSTFGVTIDWLFGLSNENTRNKSINNYSQVLEDLVTVSLSIERSSFKLSKEDSENAQLPESIDIEDPIIQHFLNTWAPVLLLYQNNIVKEDFYSEWLQSEIEEYEFIPIDLNEEDKQEYLSQLIDKRKDLEKSAVSVWKKK